MVDGWSPVDTEQFWALLVEFFPRARWMGDNTKEIYARTLASVAPVSAKRGLVDLRSHAGRQEYPPDPHAILELARDIEAIQEAKKHLAVLRPADALDAPDIARDDALWAEVSHAQPEVAQLFLQGIRRRLHGQVRLKKLRGPLGAPKPLPEADTEDA